MSVCKNMHRIWIRWCARCQRIFRVSSSSGPNGICTRLPVRNLQKSQSSADSLCWISMKHSAITQKRSPGTPCTQAARLRHRLQTLSCKLWRKMCSLPCNEKKDSPLAGEYHRSCCSTFLDPGGAGSCCAHLHSTKQHTHGTRPLYRSYTEAKYGCASTRK